jgi:hypothetical protein
MLLFHFLFALYHYQYEETVGCSSWSCYAFFNIAFYKRIRILSRKHYKNSVYMPPTLNNICPELDQVTMNEETFFPNEVVP